MKFSAVIVAAGKGARAGAGTPKQWRSLAGRPVARWSLEALLAAGARGVVVVVSPGDEARARAAFAGLEGWTLATGGAERADSVRAGLAALDGGTEAVLIHDAARPFVQSGHVEALLAALADAPGAVPALAVSDTLKRDGVDGLSTTPREGLFRAQTPQAFRLAALLEAYAAWPADETPTDDAAVLERAGGRVARTPGDPMLMKLTYAEDFAMAERLAVSAARITRTGFGYDAHRFGPGQSVWLCGVEIAHDKTLVGHSDADAGLHALTDALLGAVGEGDIGDHFPPSDPQWRGVSSDRFLRHALDLVRAKGGQVVNVDVTLICERPRIKPHREVMRARLAEILQLPLDRVSVKATTTEGMGFTGREEGLAAQAVATVETAG
ncbi:MAG TPA: bifunctional 2-C-methyl-D-erythritol 4-phosphate cytidylyltransferase/2-C-methyl-D-erythritol 2,4-cyclodiphosphate synthase [Caulobacteraceae bacterium]|jgi:2-C-methyl-D-erythritol 4-phosphate cytidylyltransferase/2-C-methyl-D-erythritol 2,4-cyclodiphosphate synthase|nr:bifunctional 2-C-methyl-D-erythritol 4-phosphate cytidylyltransferase/2-C-methyl-D-erythritol 2,4-cyclodiphosphate synthase [Caulobacteraceae bacterium]